MNVRPAVFYGGGSIASIRHSLVLSWQIDQGRSFRLPGLVPTLLQADRRLIYTIASSLLPWVFPVSGLPDTGMGAFAGTVDLTRDSPIAAGFSCPAIRSWVFDDSSEVVRDSAAAANS
jgi:hypothetical protein